MINIRQIDLIGKLKSHLYKFYPFVICSGDVFLCSYPRSGNTWTRKVLTSVLVDSTKKADITKYIPDIHRKEDRSYLTLNREKSKIIKSHLKYNSRYPKIIYIARDFRGVVSSYYNLSKKYGFKGDFDDFFERELKGFGPYGRWDKHINSYLNNCSNENDFLFLKYEDMLDNPYKSFKKIIEFSGFDYDIQVLKNVVNEKTLNYYKKMITKNLRSNLSIDEMNSLIKEKQTKKYKEHFTEKHIKRLKKNTKIYNTLIKLNYNMIAKQKH